MSEQCPINVPCPVEGQTQTPLTDTAAAPIVTPNALSKSPGCFSRENDSNCCRIERSVRSTSGRN